MGVKRYHKDVFMPNFDMTLFWKNIKKVCGTKHFLKRLAERKSVHKGMFFPTLNQLKRGEIFEIYVEEHHIEKVCLRLAGKKSDYCFVLGRNGNILTSWATGKYNKYDRIDKSIYSKEEVYAN